MNTDALATATKEVISELFTIEEVSDRRWNKKDGIVLENILFRNLLGWFKDLKTQSTLHDDERKQTIIDNFNNTVLDPIDMLIHDNKRGPVHSNDSFTIFGLYHKATRLLKLNYRQQAAEARRFVTFYRLLGDKLIDDIDDVGASE